MANTITGLIQVAYQAVWQVSRELVGIIPSVHMNAGADQVAVDQEITYPVGGVGTAEDVTPAINPPDSGSQSFTPRTMKISNSKVIPFFWTGEEEISLGSHQADLMQMQYAQAMRGLANLCEADGAALYTKASRVYGTAGTTPFSTAGDFSDAAEVLRILKDNGAPTGDLQLVIDTAAGAKLIGKQSRVDMAGETSMQRQGILLSQAGFNIRESAQIKNHTKGTAASMVTDGVSAVGATEITVDGGTGNTLAGDVISFAADANNRYVVGTGITGEDTLEINDPGIIAQIADGNAMTVGNSYTANMAFDRNALHLLARVPAMPNGGDKADLVFNVSDSISGLTFQVAVYRQYRRVRFEVGLAWGWDVVNSEHLALLLG